MMSGRRGMTRSAMSPPTIDPTPIEAAMKPHALAPPRWSRATIGPATMNAAKAKFHIACAPRLRRYHLRTATARMPSTGSGQQFLRSIPVSGGTVITARDMVLTAKVAASMTKDHAGPTVATSTPELAGPMTQVALRESPMRAFACSSFSGLTVCGVRAVEAGWKKPPAKLNTADVRTRCHRWAVWGRRRTATAAWTRPRMRAEAGRTRWRGRRSAHTPPIGREMTRATVEVARTRPRALAEWATVRVAKARATGTRASPMAEIPWPIQSRRKLVWVRGDRADGRRIGSILVQLAVPDGRLR